MRSPLGSLFLLRGHPDRVRTRSGEVTVFFLFPRIRPPTPLRSASVPCVLRAGREIFVILPQLSFYLFIRCNLSYNPRGLISLRCLCGLSPTSPRGMEWGGRLCGARDTYKVEMKGLACLWADMISTNVIDYLFATVHGTVERTNWNGLCELVVGTTP